MLQKFSILILVFSLVTSGCQQKTQTTTYFGNVMTIDYKVIIGDPLTQAEKKKVESAILEVFKETDDYYNKWNSRSELSQLNRLPAGEKHILSPQLYVLLQLTDQIVNLTEGRFDPTVETWQRVWKDHLDHNQLPDAEQLSELAHASGWKLIHFDSGTFFKDFEVTQLDLGGIAKGYCVDQMYQQLLALNLANFYIEWGGEIRTKGQHPDRRPWRIYLSNLQDPNPEHAIAKVDLVDSAIATSGDYFQNWTIEEEKCTYFHIMDPERKEPLMVNHDRCASITVLAPTCALADALATAAMVFTHVEDAKSWAEKIRGQNPNIRFWFVMR